MQVAWKVQATGQFFVQLGVEFDGYHKACMLDKTTGEDSSARTYFDHSVIRRQVSSLHNAVYDTCIGEEVLAK